MDSGWDRMTSCNKLKALNAFSTCSWETCIWPSLFNIQIRHSHWRGRTVLDVSVEGRLCLGWMSQEGNYDTRRTRRVTEPLVTLSTTKNALLSGTSLSSLCASRACFWAVGGSWSTPSEATLAQANGLEVELAYVCSRAMMMCEVKSNPGINPVYFWEEETTKEKTISLKFPAGSFSHELHKVQTWCDINNLAMGTVCKKMCPCPSQAVIKYDSLPLKQLWKIWSYYVGRPKKFKSRNGHNKAGLTLPAVTPQANQQNCPSMSVLHLSQMACERQVLFSFIQSVLCLNSSANGPVSMLLHCGVPQPFSMRPSAVQWSQKSALP